MSEIDDWMRSNLVVRASSCQCKRCNGPTALGSNPAFTDTVESVWLQMMQIYLFSMIFEKVGLPEGWLLVVAWHLLTTQHAQQGDQLQPIAATRETLVLRTAYRHRNLPMREFAQAGLQQLIRPLPPIHAYPVDLSFHMQASTTVSCM